MRISVYARLSLLAIAPVLAGAAVTSAVADSGIVRISVVKAGWFVGASGGSGTLLFHGRQYPLSIGGLSAGLVFGASKSDLVGRVSHIRRASDVSGVYGATGAGAAVGVGARMLTLRNGHGAMLQLQGQQIGLEANIDLSGLQISVQ